MNAVLLLDPATHQEVGRCAGPAPDGSCPAVGIGEVIACAGCALVPAQAAGSPPYTVSRQMTLCPCTLAAALAVPSDSALLAA